MSYTDEVEQSVTNVSQRNLIIECIARNCCHMVATNKEMQRQARKDHDLISNSTDQDQKSVTTPRNPPYQRPLTGCNETYKTVGWRTRHKRSVQPQCTIIDKGRAAPIDVTVESQRSTANEISPAQIVVVPIDIDARVTDSREIFCWPLCSKTYFVQKSLQNHCTRVHGWSNTRNQAKRGGETGGSHARNQISTCASGRR